MYKKSQAQIMEYIVMIFFVMVIIVVIIIFLSGWHFAQLKAEETKDASSRVLFLTKHLSHSPLLVKDDYMFDDGKLTALKSLGPELCGELEKIFGYDWYIEITVLDGKPKTECTWSNYPDCNYWEFCTKNEKNVTYDLPVNVYRRIGYTLSTGVFSRVDIGFIRVGVYA